LFDGNAYQEMLASLWDESPDPADWKYKTRGVILGKLHEYKRKAWEEHINKCPEWRNSE